MIPARRLRAYRRTRYSAAGCVVTIGRRVPDRLSLRLGSRSGVFISAWNPMSRRMPDGWNHRMQARLRARLRRFGSVPADGRLGRWREEHVLVNAHTRKILRIARIFRQNAVVIVQRGRPATLLLLYPVSAQGVCS